MSTLGGASIEDYWGDDSAWREFVSLLRDVLRHIVHPYGAR